MSNVMARLNEWYKMPLYQRSAIIVAVGGFLFGYVHAFSLFDILPLPRLVNQISVRIPLAVLSLSSVYISCSWIFHALGGSDGV
jgi:hypothetical protein